MSDRANYLINLGYNQGYERDLVTWAKVRCLDHTDVAYMETRLDMEIEDVNGGIPPIAPFSMPLTPPQAPTPPPTPEPEETEGPASDDDEEDY